MHYYCEDTGEFARSVLATTLNIKSKITAHNGSYPSRPPPFRVVSGEFALAAVFNGAKPGVS